MDGDRAWGRAAAGLTLLGVLLCGAASAEEFLLGREDWARPRRGDALPEIAPLRAAVNALDAAPGSRLRVHYAGGEEGSLWAHELRGWLIALGVPGRRIELLPGGSDTLNLRLEVTTAGAAGEARR